MQTTVYCLDISTTAWIFAIRISPLLEIILKTLGKFDSEQYFVLIILGNVKLVIEYGIMDLILLVICYRYKVCPILSCNNHSVIEEHHDVNSSSVTNNVSNSALLNAHNSSIALSVCAQCSSWFGGFGCHSSTGIC